MSKIVGLMGKAGSGKDTAAAALIAAGFARIAFADPIKDGLSTMLGIPRDAFDDPVLKNAPDFKYGASLRTLMQTLGTEWGRDMIRDDIWVARSGEIMDDLIRQGQDKIVISDVRLPNEAVYIRSRGGIIIRLTRGEVCTNHCESAHRSETLLESIAPDFTVANSGTIEDLHRAMLAIVLNDTRLAA